MNEQPRVAVIGAGPAGLTAAYRLTQAGADVTVFEARDWVGGRTRTDEVDGFRIDTGIQLFGSMFTGFFSLLGEIGAADLAVRAPGRDAVWRKGRVHEVVYGSVSSMLASNALPLGTKVRMGATYLPFLLRHANELSLQALERLGGTAYDTESIGEWGKREIDDAFVEYVVAPLLAASYGVSPEETAAGLYHTLASDAMTVEVFALRGGADAFCTALAERVRQGGGAVRLDAPVCRVTAVGGGVSVVTEADAAELHFDGAVLAVPAPAALRLLGSEVPALSEWMGRVEYRGTFALALMLKRPTGARYFGLSLPRGEFPTVSTVCVQENKLPELVPPGAGLLVVYPTPRAGQELLDAEPRDVLDRVLPELERVFPGISGNIQRAKLYRWPQWSPVFPPGYLQHLAGFGGGAIEGDLPIALAGDYLVAPGVEGSVVAANRAAERLLRRIKMRTTG